jgi:hypothetical protein
MRSSAAKQELKIKDEDENDDDSPATQPKSGFTGLSSSFSATSDRWMS